MNPSMFQDKNKILKGRVVRDSQEERAMTDKTFITHTVPEVFENSRIVAICGITDIYNTDDPTDSYWPADPKADGWFFSDLFAFMHLLHGQGSSQTWITSETPEYLVSRYKTYLHGNPFNDRKAVLDQELVNRGFGSGCVIVGRDSLCDSFLSHLKKESQLAKDNEQPLLVMIFGHGVEGSHEILLGENDPRNWLNMKAFREAVGDDVHVTLVTTACFSGGWCVNADLKFTTLAAAGPKRQSSSWNESASIGRYCGSIYSSALMRAWRDEAEKAQTSSSASTSEPTEATYSAFAEAVYDTLYTRIDRLASCHSLRFSAQEDDWERAWGARTGVPLINFQEQWDTLKTVAPTADLTRSVNRDPSNELEDYSADTASLVADKRSLQIRYGSLRSAKNRVKSVAQTYLKSFPYESNISCNTMLHGRLRRLLNGTTTPDWDSLQAIMVPLEFRISLSLMSTILLKRVGISLPLGSECMEFDVDAWERHLRKQMKTDSLNQKYSFAIDLVRDNVLPDPDKRQGYRWNKPHRYICAGIALAKELDSPEKISAKIVELEQGLLHIYCEKGLC
ncbi:hypothetical protein K504DRAFT_264762 [Pleomassaria siparia CBS 279.74]|uniref:CHAT domain-containing protein n=1 Tax=Pleomassaria siparia CBS 279.74 TaxID=1314801 RepID=A0A6G1KCP0_9PLEO|nr:hypothetical protein K504DRAFT_264762 [Pleomassaria siparia CBS 279.74]